MGRNESKMKQKSVDADDMVGTLVQAKEMQLICPLTSKVRRQRGRSAQAARACRLSGRTHSVCADE